MKLYGIASSYTYLEGSHGCDRCNWCHMDNVGTPPGKPFPHTDNCPTRTIKNMEAALVDAYVQIDKLKDKLKKRKRTRGKR